jgi:hypothetical protein
MKLLNRNIILPLAAAFFLMLGSYSALAQTVLDFEGLQNLESVGNFYNGGTGGNGSGPGPNFGIVFSSNGQAIIDADAGGTGNFGGEPSPSTILFFLSGTAATMNVAAGFDTGFSFFYSAVNQPGFVTVWDGPNGTGNILATLVLPITPSDGGDPNGAFSPFFPIGVAFAGTALSVDFGGTIDQIGFDNITLGSETPVVPEPGSVTLLALGAASLLAWRERRAKAA